MVVPARLSKCRNRSSIRGPSRLSDSATTGQAACGPGRREAVKQLGDLMNFRLWHDLCGNLAQVPMVRQIDHLTDLSHLSEQPEYFL